MPWEARQTHHYTSGASLAFRAPAYARSGGFQPLGSAEDARIVDEAHRAGLRVRRDAAVRVVTSSRRVGRAVGGLADHLHDLAYLQGGQDGVRVAHPAHMAWQYAGHAAARRAFATLDRCLHAVGRHDLPLGRLFEGHVDAQQVIARLAAPHLRCGVEAITASGAIFGVWNADLPAEALRLEDGRLSGGKAYASGAGVISHAVVSADVADGRQLILIDLTVTPPTIDRSWWRVVGMQRSETHLVCWADVPVAEAALIGPPNSYATEPWFSGGALRFVAVQAGGVAGLLDRVRDHLVETGRASDPHQAGRLAELFDCADLAAAAVRTAAASWRTDSDAVRLVRVVATRGEVAALADRAIALAQQSVGLQGLFHAHPLAAAITDLTVYLRQPAPDAQRVKVAQAVAAGTLTSAL